MEGDSLDQGELLTQHFITPVHVLSVSEALHWLQVKVGDIVQVRNHQFFPADLAFLSSRYL